MVGATVSTARKRRQSRNLRDMIITRFYIRDVYPNMTVRLALEHPTKKGEGGFLLEDGFLLIDLAKQHVLYNGERVSSDVADALIHAMKRAGLWDLIHDVSQRVKKVNEKVQKLTPWIDVRSTEPQSGLVVTFISPITLTSTLSVRFRPLKEGEERLKWECTFPDSPELCRKLVNEFLEAIEREKELKESFIETLRKLNELSKLEEELQRKIEGRRLGDVLRGV